MDNLRKTTTANGGRLRAVSDGGRGTGVPGGGPIQSQ